MAYGPIQKIIGLSRNRPRSFLQILANKILIQSVFPFEVIVSNFSPAGTSESDISWRPQGRSESTQTPELLVLKWRTSYVKVKGNKPVKRKSYTKETASLKPFATILSQSLLSNNFIVRAKRNRGWQPINLREFLEFVSHVIYILIIVISL